MKRGDYCVACYDNKWIRGTPGRVVATRKGSAILVEFKEYAKNEKVVAWFSKKKSSKKWGGSNHFAGYAKVENSIMAGFFGLPGDYYTIQRVKKWDGWCRKYNPNIVSLDYGSLDKPESTDSFSVLDGV